MDSSAFICLKEFEEMLRDGTHSLLEAVVIVLSDEGFTLVDEMNEFDAFRVFHVQKILDANNLRMKVIKMIEEDMKLPMNSSQKVTTYAQGLYLINTLTSHVNR